MIYQNWYMHFGAAADRDQEIVDLRNPPAPLVVIDTSEADE